MASSQNASVSDGMRNKDVTQQEKNKAKERTNSDTSDTSDIYKHIQSQVVCILYSR